MRQVAPAQWIFSAHESGPAQVTVFVAAYVDTVERHEPIPSHVVVQESPEQVMEPEQLFSPLQRMSEVEALLLMAPRQAFPLQVTRQLVPEHWIGPLQALLAHVTVQLLASKQSTPAAHPPGPQSTLHGWSRGQATAVGHEPGGSQAKKHPDD